MCRMAAILAALVAMLLAACGGNSAEVRADAPGVGAVAEGQTGTSTVDPPLTSPRLRNPEPVADVAVLSENPNDASTSMGALCWARWEIARHQLLRVAEPTKAISLRDNLGAVASSPARTTVFAEKLPEGVSLFAEALFDEMDTKLGLESDALDVDFEALSGAEQYVAAASNEPGCARP